MGATLLALLVMAAAAAVYGVAVTSLVGLVRDGAVPRRAPWVGPPWPDDLV